MVLVNSRPRQRPRGSIHRARVSAIIAVMVAGLVASACSSASPSSGSGDSTGVSSGTITIGLPTPLSGIYKFYNGYYTPGYQAVFDKINAAGGIDGRKIKLVTADSGCGSTTQAVSAGRSLLQQDNAFMLIGALCGAAATINSSFLMGTDMAQLTIQNADIGQNGVSVPSKATGYTYNFSPSVGTQTLNVLGYVFSKVISNPGAQTIGILEENDIYGYGVVAAVQAYLKSKGMKPANVAEIDPTATDASVQIEKLKAAGSTVLVLGGLPVPMTAGVNQAAAIGWHPTIIGDEPPTAPEVVAAYNASELPNFYGAAYLGPQPGSAAYSKTLAEYQKYSSTTLNADNSAQPIDLAVAVVTALQRAGKDLSEASFIKALQAGPITLPFAGQVNIVAGGTSEVERGVEIIHFTGSGKQIVLHDLGPGVIPPASLTYGVSD
jgi:branched-chain amino acid transport system substrate-binding protein